MQEGYFQLVGRLQHLSEPVAPLDQVSPSAFAASAASVLERTTSTHIVVVPPPEPRVPTPERFTGD